MRIPCPVCATLIMAGEEHVGMKNRCVTCRTKFLIPAREDGVAQILERGVAPQANVPKLLVHPPETASPINPGTGEKAPPHKLLTSTDPLRAPTNAPDAKPFRALPSVPPPHPSGTEPPPKIQIHLRKKLVRRKIAKKKAVKKHSLEHLPALDPGPPEQDNPGQSPAPTGTPSGPLDTGASR